MAKKTNKYKHFVSLSYARYKFFRTYHGRSNLQPKTNPLRVSVQCRLLPLMNPVRPSPRFRYRLHHTHHHRSSRRPNSRDAQSRGCACHCFTRSVTSANRTCIPTHPCHSAPHHSTPSPPQTTTALDDQQLVSTVRLFGFRPSS